MSNVSNHATYNCVQTLLDTLIDVEEGYAVLVERADPSIRPLIQKVAHQHADDITDIEQTAQSCGIELDHSGTVMGEIHKAAVKFRDFVSDIDRDVLTSVADGEENVVKMYGTAIKELPHTHKLHILLTHQREELRGKISDLFAAA